MVIRLRLNLVLYLTAVLVALKGFEVIDWSWGWILAPLWAPVLIVSGVAVVGLFFAATLLAKVKKSFGLSTKPSNEEFVINGDVGPVASGARPSQRVGNIYDHE